MPPSTRFPAATPAERRTIAAPVYNRIRLGLLRATRPLELPLPGLRGLDMVLDHRTWVCRDHTLYGTPVLTLMRFRPADRTSLQEPVACQLIHHHVHAGFILESILHATVLALHERQARLMAARAPTALSEVLDFPDPTGGALPA